MQKRVIIIGGGFSGLAAGVELSERRYVVTLLERRNHLGGRAYSFTDAKTGDTVDNGQHLFMGCYTNTIDFLKRIGCLNKLKFQERAQVDFLDAEKGFDRFDCPPLPAPLHVLGGLFRLKGLTLGDKLRALNLRRILKSKLNGNGSLTVTELLKKLHQSKRINERFWHPLVVATLNESPDVASAKMLVKVLQEAFGAGREASAIGISSVGLSDLYVEGASQFITERGGEITTLTSVTRLVIEGDKVVALELKNGERLQADYFISAIPPSALLQLLDVEIREKYFRYLEKLKAAPIVSINLWFDKPFIDRQFVGLIGTQIQWLFNKDKISASSKNTNHLTLIISAAHDYVDWTKEELVELALNELHYLLPQSREASLLHSTIVKEREATISHTIESDSLRPAAQTPINNLILAGDWTDTGLPATIESAVLSGYTAARAIAD